MDEDIRLLRSLRMEGVCCAGIIVRVGLHLRGEENEQFAASVAGLCNGVHRGMLCGALTGAACMLSMFGSEPSDIPMMAGEIAGWFDAVYGEKYGGSDCRTITDEDPMTRFERCPDIIEATYVKAREILADYGKI